MEFPSCCLVAATVLFASNVHGADGEWVSMFDGESLDGWTQINGTAEYEVQEGVIIGTTVEGSPNSFLCTEKTYIDFELEFDVQVDSRLNSGVQIRPILNCPIEGE